MIMGQTAKKIGDMECRRYNTVEAGRVLAEFICRIDSVGSEIGEYRVPERRGDDILMVTGMQLENSIDGPVHILTRLSMAIEVNSIFNEYRGDTPMQMLREYFRVSDVPNRDKIEIPVMNKLRALMGNKQLIVPFKPFEKCKLDLGLSAGEKSGDIVDTEIRAVLWRVEGKIGKLSNSIIMRQKQGWRREEIFKIPIEEYGTTFRVNNIEEGLKTGEIDRNTVKVTRFGYVKPLVLKGKNVRVAIDGRNIYIVDGYDIWVLGRWEYNGKGKAEEELKRQIGNCNVYKYLMKNLDYIEKHRRFIAPFKLVDANEIQI